MRCARLAAAMAVILVWSGEARADEFCSGLHDFLAQASRNAVPIVAGDNPSRKLARAPLPGAECTVDTSPADNDHTGTSIVLCTWTVSQEGYDAQVNQMAEKVGDCLGVAGTRDMGEFEFKTPDGTMVLEDDTQALYDGSETSRIFMLSISPNPNSAMP